MSALPNPFTATRPIKTTETLPDVRDELMGKDLLVTGPTKPGLSPTLEAPQTPWPHQDIGVFEGQAIMGLHGGAGATTLTGLLGPTAADIGQTWPVSHSTRTQATWPLPVIAVARTDRTGLSTAERFIRSWANSQLPGSKLSALVLIEAGPRTSEARKKATKRLLRMVPRGVHIPWMDSWLDAPPDPNRLPGRIKRIIKVLNTPTQ